MVSVFSIPWGTYYFDLIRVRLNIGVFDITPDEI